MFMKTPSVSASPVSRRSVVVCLSVLFLPPQLTLMTYVHGVRLLVVRVAVRHCGRMGSMPHWLARCPRHGCGMVCPHLRCRRLWPFFAYKTRREVVGYVPPRPLNQHRSLGAGYGRWLPHGQFACRRQMQGEVSCQLSLTPFGRSGKPLRWFRWARLELESFVNHEVEEHDVRCGIVCWLSS